MSLDITLTAMRPIGVFDVNITHNLSKMASEAGLYQAMWAPEEIPAKSAGELIKLLEDGLAKLRNDKEHFEKFNPSNGWGSYETLVKVVEEYLDACKQNPDAAISVWR